MEAPRLDLAQTIRRAELADKAARDTIERAAQAHELSAELHERMSQLYSERARYERRANRWERANRAETRAALAEQRASQERYAAENLREAILDNVPSGYSPVSRKARTPKEPKENT